MTEQPIRIVSDSRRFPWWVVLVVGIVVIVAGIGLVVWPFVAASQMLAVFFGLALIANGLAMLVRGGPNATSRVLGVVFIIAGVLAMIFAAFTVQALVVLVGAALLVLGVSWIVVGMRIGAGRGGFIMVPGVLAVLGGIFALIWPAAALSIVAFCAGIAMLLFGASLIWGATRLRSTRVDQTTIIVE
ncbi:DUF308 domain-containing protein [Leucobacter luti]|uniref:Uncharacterized membrane protein HdeD (DUF308 family) n=1 Tax=Leucobacter luti TaxID=340320 RepID=A0A4R6RTI0_9MICO|nr:DUF308 domain-containing protein [Leucobacter luti]MCW2287892.1 uncharacterized membrane protein HdeD (DUF308 family) [Leucobacter luti]QYM76107.1 DUF308 domain-containing protein [Leucobacter luti]TCK45945.1 uncharacterized membrane protein HdeD (DUF308 family) [Leucobacter luti]TDP90162.1 uncharacterized membrane protein HdeD (DUF308 family) [Leucobacter luti]